MNTILEVSGSCSPCVSLSKVRQECLTSTVEPLTGHVEPDSIVRLAAFPKKKRDNWFHRAGGTNVPRVVA